MEIEAHVCEFCERVDVRWVRWQNERGEAHFFCDNRCLSEWIARGLDRLRCEAALEHGLLRWLEAS